jgi:multidrug resistance efflux pump
MISERTFRIGAGVACVAAALSIIGPHVVTRVSQAAVVNAPVISIKSPFDGILTSDAMAPATPILPGTALFEVQASRSSRTELDRLRARIDTLALEETSLAREIATLSRLNEELDARMEDVRGLAVNVLQAQLSGMAGELAAAEIRQRRLERDATRLETLHRAGSVPEAQAETARALAEEARGEVIRLRAAIREATTEIAGVENGILSGLGTEDGSYAQQRQDEVTIRLADLEGRKARVTANREGLQKKAKALQAEVESFDQFAPVLPVGVLVWSATPTQGAAVAAGDEVVQLLDCSRRFVEVFLPETAFEAIRPGDTATVQLRGSARTFQASVEAVRGTGNRGANGLLAAQPQQVPDGSLSALLRLESVDVTEVGIATSFCDVGRTAEVRFERGFNTALNLPVRILSRLFGRFSQTVAAPGIEADRDGGVDGADGHAL